MDFLEFLPSAAWSEEYYLSTLAVPATATTPAKSAMPIYSFLDRNTGFLWDIKGPGRPWDSFFVGEDFIYNVHTENDKMNWDAPGYSSTFKRFVSKTWPNGLGGIAWCPRYFNEGGPNPGTVTADSSFQYYAACKPVLPVENVGPTMTTIEGPYDIDFGGDLKTQKAAVQRFYWGSTPAGYQTMEVNYHVKPPATDQPGGRVQWEKWVLTKGIYTLVLTSAFNRVMKGAPPKLDFPCSVTA